MRKVLKPAVFKLFCSKDKFYCYDTNMNQILLLPKELFKELLLVQKMGIQTYETDSEENEFKKDILLLHKKGYFEICNIEEVCHPYTYNSSVLLNRAMNQLVLEVSEGCNFRCLYCHQRLNDDFKNRVMTFDIAKESLI